MCGIMYESLTCKVLDVDGQSSIAISILLKFFICENKNLNPHYPGLITGAAP